MKKLSLIAVFVLFALTLTGCLNKSVKTTDDFVKLAEEKKMKITNAIDQFGYVDFIEEANVATADGWQVEFYVLSDVVEAEGMYETNVAKFEAKKANSSTETSSEMGNYDSYGLTTAGFYMYVARVENTLIYLDVEEEYKEDAKAFIEEFGY